MISFDGKSTAQKTVDDIYVKIDVLKLLQSQARKEGYNEDAENYGAQIAIYRECVNLIFKNFRMTI